MLCYNFVFHILYFSLMIKDITCHIQVTVNACTAGMGRQRVTVEDDYTIKISFESSGAQVILCQCYIWRETQHFGDVSMELRFKHDLYEFCTDGGYPCDYFEYQECDRGVCRDRVRITNTESSDTLSDRHFNDIQLLDVLMRYVRYDHEDVGDDNKVSSMFIRGIAPVPVNIQCGPLDSVWDKPRRPEFGKQITSPQPTTTTSPSATRPSATNSTTTSVQDAGIQSASKGLKQNQSQDATGYIAGISILVVFTCGSFMLVGVMVFHYRRQIGVMHQSKEEAMNPDNISDVYDEGTSPSLRRANPYNGEKRIGPISDGPTSSRAYISVIT